MRLSLEIDSEAYGGDARKTALADFLEVQAFRGPSMTRGQLAEFAADAGWGRRWATKFIDVSEEGDAEGPTAGDLADGAFDAIAERVDLLQDCYPFRVNHAGSLARVEPETCAYDLFLAICMSHVHGLDIGANPRDYLEGVVVRCMHRLGLRASAVAAFTRGGAAFAESLQSACREVGLIAYPTEAIRRRKAFDGGVDVLAHLPLSPTRNAIWAGIGQVTCARSDEWERKLKEPSPRKWNGFLGGPLLPIPFLAIPYHVTGIEFRHLEQSSDTHGGFVLDRLSLTRALHADTSPADVDIASRLRTVEVIGPHALAGRVP